MASVVKSTLATTHPTLGYTRYDCAGRCPSPYQLVHTGPRPYVLRHCRQEWHGQVDEVRKLIVVICQTNSHQLFLFNCRLFVNVKKQK